MLERQWEAAQNAAIEAADVVFMNSNMDAVPKSIAISKKATAIAKQNVVFALAIKIMVNVYLD